MNDELDHIFGDDPDLVDEDAPVIDSDVDPGGSLPGGTAELVALAASDANELLRFVESAMTEAEAAAFLADVESRDPESASKLLQMREDQRLLRTSVELEPPPPDLLGPVRAQLARGELVQVQGEIGSEEVDQTAFMARSVATLARRRRRARRRPLAVAAIFGTIGVLLGVIVAPRLGGGGAESFEPSFGFAGEAASSKSLASFGLVLPVRSRSRMELAMSIVAVNHGAVLVRNASAGSDEGDPEATLPLVGPASSAPDLELQRELASRGFDYAFVVDRREVSLVLAEVGALADSGTDEPTTARLVPSSSTDPGASLKEDAWESWSSQSQASRGMPVEVRKLVVPIAIVELAD